MEYTLNNFDLIVEKVNSFVNKIKVYYNPLCYDREDILQDTVMSIFSIIQEKSKINENELNFLMQIEIKKIYRKFYRKKSQNYSNTLLFSALQSTDLKSEDKNIDKVEFQDLIKKLKKLSTNKEKLIIDYLYLGYSVNEISNLLNCSNKTVYYYISRIRKNLEKLLEKI